MKSGRARDFDIYNLETSRNFMLVSSVHPALALDVISLIHSSRGLRLKSA
jgi:hypothetical protein